MSMRVFLRRRKDGCEANIYCSPKAGDIWLANGTTYQAIWNTANFGTNQRIVTELVDISSPTGYLQLKTYDNSVGFAPINLSDLDFGGPVDTNNFREKKVRLMIYPEGSSGPKVPGPVFTIVQPGRNGAFPILSTSSTAPPTTVTVNITPTPSPSLNGAQKKEGLPQHLVLIVSLSATFIFLFALCVGFAIRRYKKNSSILSETRAAGFSAGKNPRHFLNGSLDSNAPLTAPIRQVDGDTVSASSHHFPLTATPSGLSANEALMIANTYRQIMRKPSWGSKPDEDEDDSREIQASELIAKELAQEGRDIQVVKRGSGVKVEALQGN